MENSKNPLKRTKAFVKKHKTPIACVATAVGTVFVMNANEFIRTGATIAAKDFMLLDACVFIENKGLWTEFLETARHYKGNV